MTQRIRIALYIFATCFVFSHTAWSRPSEEVDVAEYQAADLLVDVEVLSVDCDGAPSMSMYSEATGETVDIYHYIASLRVLRIERAPEGSTIQVGSELDYFFDLETEQYAQFNTGLEADTDAPGTLATGWVGRLHLRLVPHGTELAFAGGASEYTEQSNPAPLYLCVTTDQDEYNGAGYCGSEPPEMEDGQDGQEPSVASSCSWTGPSPANHGWSWLALPLVGLFVARRRKT